MPQLNVGDRVVIDWDVATYIPGDNNPPSGEGRVSFADEGVGDFVYGVHWDNGRRNNYREGELKLANGTVRSRATPTPKTLPSLIKQAKDKLKKWNDNGNNGVAIHLKKDIAPSISTGPCHGFIRDNGSRNSLAIVSLLKRTGGSPGRQQCSKDVVVRYCDWLFNRSPWSECFMYKSAENAWNEHSCVLRVDVPANILQGALISTRNTWEFAPRINLWHTLVTEHGVDEHVAFLAVFYVSVDDGEISVAGIHTDHVAITTHGMTEEGARAFLSNSPLKKKKNYNEGGTYSGVVDAFKGDGDSLYNDFTNKFNSYGKSGVVKNIFAKALPKKTQRRTMAVPQYAMFVTEYFGRFKQA